MCKIDVSINALLFDWQHEHIFRAWILMGEAWVIFFAVNWLIFGTDWVSSASCMLFHSICLVGHQRVQWLSTCFN